MDDPQLLRYSRHILLPEIDIAGQQALLDATALIVGAGGLGAPASLYLAAAGVGRIILCDDDEVDLTNLQRQIIHDASSVGRLKVDSGFDALHRLNPDVVVETVPERLDEARLAELAARASVVLDCTDNFATRHAINRACVAQRRALVSGAAIRFSGQVTVFDLRQADSACYHCLFAEEAGADETRCSVMGVFAPLTGMVGTVQAAEALKLLMGIGVPLAGRLLLLDALGMEWRTVRYERDPGCPVCHKRQN